MQYQNKSAMQIANEVKLQVQKIEQEADKVYIVNAGRMNHGKSSLLNSLLGTDTFAVGDIRTTKEYKSAKFKDNVYFIDTPGLDAVESDDKAAFEAYKKADFVMFVHTPSTGELHKDALTKINEIANTFPSKAYFWQHFCLVFTFLEKTSSDDLAKIEAKIIRDIKTECGGMDFPIFRVSNSRYEKGIRENKLALVKLSGIEELKNYLLSKVSEWSSEHEKLKADKVNQIKNQALSELKARQTNKNREYQDKKYNVDMERSRLTSIIEQVNALSNQYYVKSSEADAVSREINSLQEQHRSDRARY